MTLFSEKYWNNWRSNKTPQFPSTQLYPMDKEKAGILLEVTSNPYLSGLDQF